MVKTSKMRKSRSSSKQKSRRQAQHGGNLAGNPPSAWGWVNGTLGNGWNQFMNSLSLQPGMNAGTSQSNNIVPNGNVNAEDSQPMLNYKMDGGKKRGPKKQAKRGGSWLAVANQAIVPGVLLAAQETLFQKNKSRKNTKKFRGSRSNH